MTIGLRNGLGAAVTALALGLGTSIAARADDVGPAQAKALFAQGQMNLVQGKVGSAAADLGQAVRLNPTDAYNVLWLHFARTKESAPDAGELQFNAGRANHAAWPGPLLDYLTGKIDAAAALARADEAQGVAKAKAVCEANLFIGREDRARGRRNEALERLQTAARVCDGATHEARLAVADLEALGATKPALTPVSNAAPKAAAKISPARSEPALKPASVKSEPPTQTQTRAPAGDLLLRGSLK